MHVVCFTQDLWSKVPEGEAFDVFPYISSFTLDVMLRCTCSFESNCQIEKLATGLENHYDFAYFELFIISYTLRAHNTYVAAIHQITELLTKRTL